MHWFPPLLSSKRLLFFPMSWEKTPKSLSFDMCTFLSVSVLLPCIILNIALWLVLHEKIYCGRISNSYWVLLYEDIDICVGKRKKKNMKNLITGLSVPLWDWCLSGATIGLTPYLFPQGKSTQLLVTCSCSEVPFA